MDQTEIIERERRALQLSLFEKPVRLSDDNGPLSEILDSDDNTPSIEVLLSGPRPWTARELEAWAPPDSSLVSDWAAKHRVLSANSSAFIGEWQHRGYYGVEIMDAFLDPVVEEITLMAAAQAMKTDLTYNMLGYAADQDPAPAIVAMPSLKALGKANERIKDMIKESPALQKQLTGLEDDLSLSKIKLRRMSIHFVTAGSTVDTRNLPARYIFEDEVDDYPETSGRGTQGAPMGQLEARATSYWNRKIVKSCTPTLEGGNINTELGKSDKRWYWMPCPHCMGYQVLSFWQIKHVGCKLGEWPMDRRDKDYIISKSVARYECIHCKAEIDERHKSWMDSMGTWVPECGVSEHSEHCSDCLQLRLKPKEITSKHCVRILRDGTVSIPRPRTRHRGYRWGAEISPFRSWSEMAAKFFEVKDNPEDYKVFVNLWLAEVWKGNQKERKESAILLLRDERPRGLVPSEGVIGITCGADTQDNGFYYVVRAWGNPVGHKLESWLIREGFVETKEALEKIIFGRYQDATGQEYLVNFTLIDAMGHRTLEIYLWCFGKAQIKPSKGVQKMSAPFSVSIINTIPGTKKPLPGGVSLYSLNSTAYKDDLANKLEISPADPGAFHLHSEVGDEYASQMSIEYRDEHGIWQCPERKANHFWDCEYLALAAADIIGIQHWGLMNEQAGEAPANQEGQQAAQSNAASRRGRRW